MFKVTDHAGQEIATEEKLAKAYQKANDYVEGHGKDVCVWDDPKLNAVFVYQHPTVIVKPRGSLTLVIVAS